MPMMDQVEQAIVARLLPSQAVEHGGDAAAAPTAGGSAGAGAGGAGGGAEEVSQREIDGRGSVMLMLFRYQVVIFGTFVLRGFC